MADADPDIVASAHRKFGRELNAGSLSLLVLAVVCSAAEPVYGYEVGKKLEDAAGGELPTTTGALYPVLRSLEKQGLLDSSTRPSTDGPARRYYAPTPAGRQILPEWRERWDALAALVNQVLQEGS